MKRLSIGLRLTLWYVAIFAAAELFFGVGMWFVLRQNLYSIADRALRDQVDDLVHFLQAQKKDASIAKLQEEVSEAYVLEHSGDYLQIYESSGEWIYRAAFMQEHPVALVDPGSLREASSRDLQVGNKPFRFLTQRLEVNGHAYIVQTGLPATQIIQTLSLFRRYLLMLAPVLLLAAAGGGYWLSRRALSPVDAITQTARNISGTNLHNHRLERLTTGDELQRLSDTLNQMLDRLEDAFRRVTQFTADASHELRSPISVIRTEAEIVLRRPRSDERYREALRNILAEAERTSSLVDKLLSLARADSGGENLSLRQADLRAIIVEFGDRWRQVVAARGLEFRQVLADQELRVMADPMALQQLLAILLDNAVKYTPSPGVIKLSLQGNGAKAVISVQDSGIGIDPEDQTRIFERFYRVDKARSRQAGGVGLGLAIAQWIAEQHHGLIQVYSVPEEGTTFAVELPLLPAGATVRLAESSVA
jgi:heavy metal sensor kinase